MTDRGGVWRFYPLGGKETKDGITVGWKVSHGGRRLSCRSFRHGGFTRGDSYQFYGETGDGRKGDVKTTNEKKCLGRRIYCNITNSSSIHIPHALNYNRDFLPGVTAQRSTVPHGAFGWTISTIQGERVASGMGPSRGSRMDSYRAECSGVLSILRFLIQIATFTAMHEPWQGVIGTDSKSLLDKLSPNPTSYDTNQEAGKRVHLDELTPEWDLLIEIQEGLRLLPGVSLTHVKGHQDDSQPYDRLSLLAQLNVDADKMATSFQTKHGLARPIALMTPNTGIHLVHSTGTITGKYEDRIRLISTSPALVSKIQTKYHWSDSTMRMVHWKAHGKAIKVHHTRRVHLSKLIHDCLPTHELLNKFDSGKRTCSLCQHHCEDRDHIIRCPHSSRETWRLSPAKSQHIP
ncbi:hypothetical protein MHU86_24302 [Fragilaria crotonensis]|nr:hypothetical protein MHU86_24302 [Fragilaria crotonensis]